MPRCDYDIIFYRVFCITLLGIAFTFTVILTNVFVDIDGLLYNEEKTKNSKLESPTTPVPKLLNSPTKIDKTDDQPQDPINEELTAIYRYDKQYEDDDNDDNNLERSKRSLDKTKFKINVRNPKVKMLLSKQLSSLLEGLEEEETSTTYDTTVSETSFTPNNNGNTAEKLKEIDKIEKEGVLHLAMHNILLKGIINHMDLNDIYKTVNELSNANVKKTDKLVAKKPGVDQQIAEAENIENKFLEELANCTKLRQEVMSATKARTAKNNTKSPRKDTKIVINTLIDIKSVNDGNEKEQNKSKKENVIGVVKLWYNGKSVSIIDANDIAKNYTDANLINIANIFQEKVTLQPETTESYFKSAVDDYVSKFYKRESSLYPQLTEFLETHRSKRNALLKNPSHHKKGHKNADEFYVEIETRFDKKDMDSGKKKQFVKDLIKKIQKAIRTKDDPLKLNQKLIHQKPKHRIVQFKKRILSPLADPLVKKLGITADHVVHRQLDPISKIVPIREHFGPDRIASNSKDAWKNVHEFPSFLSKAKSINSAEIGQVNVAYDQVSDGIPQRLQVPLNTNNFNEPLEGQQVDVGDIKLSIKDLDGTGLSIGFNQYLPESDKFVVYDGLENIFEHFPENYEQADKKMPIVSADVNDELAKTMESFHDIIKRSAQFDQDRDLSQDKELNVDLVNINQSHQNISLASLFGLGMMEKHKKTLSVQKFFNRRNKIKLKQYLNTNAIATKHKKYVLRNIQPQVNRRRRDLSNIRILTDILPGDVIVNPDRSQENIFIVSDENIFEQTPASIRRPKIADNTATYDKTVIDQYDLLPSPDDFIYRDVKYAQDDIPREREHEPDNERERPHEVNRNSMHRRDRDPVSNREHQQDNNLGHIVEHEPEIDQPPIFEQEELHEPENKRERNQESPIYHIHGDLMKNDPVLSNYPHIVSDKNEDNIIPNIIFEPQEIMDAIEPTNNEIKPPILNDPRPKPTENSERSPDLEELTSALAPKTSYKVTVKLLPKNDTNSDGTGVKEVFTTINKTFNKNGLLYSRLVNVSEIAKIESLNETGPNPFLDILNQDNHGNKNLEPKKQEDNKLKKSENEKRELKQQRQKLKDLISKQTENNKNIAQILNKPNIINGKRPSIHDLLSFTPIPSRVRELSTKKNFVFTTTLKPLPNNPRIVTLRTDIPKLENKMTSAILAKIEENTNTLKTFLQRLNKLEEGPKRQTGFPGAPNFLPMPNPHSFAMPAGGNIDTQRNTSFIPFVYAYEHPLPVASPNQTDNNMSVVYHGHIHTKTGPKVKNFDIDQLSGQKHSKRNALRSRFFLDDVGTVIGAPMNVFKYKNYIKNPKIKINSTILI